MKISHADTDVLPLELSTCLSHLDDGPHYPSPAGSVTALSGDAGRGRASGL
jgi:hypothetical protein